MKIINRTKLALGWNNPFQTRLLSQITHIAIHHSGTEDGDTNAFESFWSRNFGWRNGGYGWTILRNGNVEHNYPATVVTNGVAGHNGYILNICVVGNGQFTYKQEESLETLVRQLMAEFNIPVSNVWGHNEFPNNPTICPGRDMDALRRRLAQNASNIQSPAPTPKPSSHSHVVKSGETLFGISRQHGVTVEELQSANGLGSGTLIYPNQILIIPRPASTKTIQVGTKVRVRQSATNWATGERIPNWVKNEVYTVRQFRNQNREALLMPVTSWVRVTDLKAV